MEYNIEGSVCSKGGKNTSTFPTVLKCAFSASVT